MSKNKGNKGNKGKNKGSELDGAVTEGLETQGSETQESELQELEIQPEEGTSAPKKPRKARSPLGPLPVRLCEKADKVHTMVATMAKELASRGAPQDVRGTTTAFLTQVETWRESFFALKNSGWAPASSARSTSSPISAAPISTSPRATSTSPASWP